MKRTEISKILYDMFDIARIKDISLNGVQIEGAEEVRNIAFAVDTNEYIIDKAISENVDFLCVHHGIFWGKLKPIESVLKNRIKKLLCNDITLFAIHLPLDFHMELGNNRYILDLFNVQNIQPFLDYYGYPMGLTGDLPEYFSISEIKEILETKLGKIKNMIIKNNEVKKIAVITGSANSLIDDIFKEDFDLLISGNITHESYFPFLESGKSAIFMGHYLSEIGGVSYLKKYFEKNFENEFDKILFFDYDSNL